MRDEVAARAVVDGDDERIQVILGEVCSLTDMGFAAVARVTESRWIACQVLDKIEFGLSPGGELEVQKTICNEIRGHGSAVIFDDASVDEKWRPHPVPVLYGFKSYASFPIVLGDGTFYGTLCAIDPMKRRIATPAVVEAMTIYAKRVAAIIEQRDRTTGPS